ncbi:MAG: hypothetical protein KJ792_04640 [Actinobacteria bacterium]|nr:hypothetical protein [Actinomycetota bacterium]MCG2801423.1 DUF6318 family protein [Cellulomonas sp.]
MTRLVGVALLLAATAASAAGCTGHSAASPTAPVTATPTLPAPMASPGRPDQWPETGELGAQAAAVWFVRDLYSYVVETNDLTDWQALSEPGCEFCQSAADNAAAASTAGTVQRLAGVTASVTRVETLNPLAYSVLLDYADGTTLVYTATGELVTTLDPADGQLLVVVYRVGHDWHLREGQWFGRGAVVPTAGASS